MARRLGVDLRITRLLLQIGMMCARIGRYVDAETIIRGVKAFRSDLPHPGTTLATAYLFQGRLDEAAQELEAVLAVYPNHQLGKAFLGLVHRQLGRHGWQRWLQEVIADGRDETAMECARLCLESDDEAIPSRAPEPAHPLPMAAASRWLAPRQYA